VNRSSRRALIKVIPRTIQCMCHLRYQSESDADVYCSREACLDRLAREAQTFLQTAIEGLWTAHRPIVFVCVFLEVVPFSLPVKVSNIYTRVDEAPMRGIYALGKVINGGALPRSPRLMSEQASSGPTIIPPSAASRRGAVPPSQTSSLSATGAN
jgi:hypothetical protein